MNEVEEVEWPVPEHDLMAALLAVTFQKHGWPANTDARFGVPSIGGWDEVRLQA